MATYPGGVREWTTKRDFNQTIIESHMNDIQSELVAAEKIFGVNPQIATNNPGGFLRDYLTVTDRITSMVRGEHLPYFGAALFEYKLHPSSQDNNPDVPATDPDGSPLTWCGSGHRQRAKQLRLSSGEQIYLPYHWEVDDRDGIGFPWLGLPLEQDGVSVADGGWQRLPLIGQDDPFGMGRGDGLQLNQTGLWMISLRVDHLPDEDSINVRARHRARLEINGKAHTLQHLVRSTAENGSYLTNYVHWIEVLKGGTAITASARVDGTDLTESISANAYLRAHLIRCTDDEDDGMLKDFPASIYKPPPAPPPYVPSVPSTPRQDTYTPPPVYLAGGSLDGPYAYEARPGEWYGMYGYGSVGPQSGPFFPGIGSYYAGPGSSGRL